MWAVGNINNKSKEAIVVKEYKDAVQMAVSKGYFSLTSGNTWILAKCEHEKGIRFSSYTQIKYTNIEDNDYFLISNR